MSRNRNNLVLSGTELKSLCLKAAAATDPEETSHADALFARVMAGLHEPRSLEVHASGETLLKFDVLPARTASIPAPAPRLRLVPNAVVVPTTPAADAAATPPRIHQGTSWTRPSTPSDRTAPVCCAATGRPARRRDVALWTLLLLGSAPLRPRQSMACLQSLWGEHRRQRETAGALLQTG